MKENALKIKRRSFFRALLVAGLWLAGGSRKAARTLEARIPGRGRPRFLPASEHAYINRMAREIIPDEPVLSGRVDVAANTMQFRGFGNPLTSEKEWIMV